MLALEDLTADCNGLCTKADRIIGAQEERQGNFKGIGPLPASL